MNPAQIHLMLNHVPVVGTLFTLVLVVIAVTTGNRHVLRIALATALVVSGITIPVFLSGGPVEELVEDLPGVSETLVERHEGAARIALGLVLTLGLIALVGLVRFRGGPIPRGLAVMALVMNLGAVAQMAWTAHLGGQIRHTEIRADAVPSDGARATQQETDQD